MRRGNGRTACSQRRRGREERVARVRATAAASEPRHDPSGLDRPVYPPRPPRSLVKGSVKGAWRVRGADVRMMATAASAAQSGFSLFWRFRGRDPSPPSPALAGAHLAQNGRARPGRAWYRNPGALPVSVMLLPWQVPGGPARSHQTKICDETDHRSCASIPSAMERVGVVGGTGCLRGWSTTGSGRMEPNE